MKLTVSTTIDAPLSYVRECMRHPDHIIHRAFADEATRCCPWARGSEPKVGEVFTTRMEAKDGSFGFDLVGQYTSVNPINSFSYVLGSYERDADFISAGRVVDVTFEQTDNGIVVTQVFDAEDVHSSEQQTQGRQMILENFKKHVEAMI